MSYAAANAVQAAVYGALIGDVALAALVGGAIHDAEPDAPPDLYVALGPERVREASDASGRGAEHRITVSVVTSRSGFSAAKAAAGRVEAVLHGADLALDEGRLVDLAFVEARARRDRRDRTRRVDMVFRARTDG